MGTGFLFRISLVSDLCSDGMCICRSFRLHAKVDGKNGRSEEEEEEEGDRQE